MGGTASGAALVRQRLMPVSGLHRQIASIALDRGEDQALVTATASINDYFGLDEERNDE